MNFEQLAYRAANQANRAAKEVTENYAHGMYGDEPEITAGLVTLLKRNFADRKFAGLKWSATVFRHYSGRAAEEKRMGADLLMHVSLDTPQHKYEKGVLVQAKRQRKSINLSGDEHQELVEQCNTMLQHTPASFVLHYTPTEITCGSAVVIAGSTDRNLGRQCLWNSHRFFLELFRCFIGDPGITIGLADDLRVLNAIKITGTGEIDLDDDEVKPQSS